MDISKVLIPEEEIQAMVKRVASEINRDYEGKEVVVIGVLTGAFIFTADLVRELNEDVAKEYVSSICPELIANYEFTDPKRKIYCTGIVHACVRSFAKIMERECGVAIK